MGYLIAAYVIAVGSVASYAIYLGLERQRLRASLEDREAVSGPAGSPEANPG